MDKHDYENLILLVVVGSVLLTLAVYGVGSAVQVGVAFALGWLYSQSDRFS